MINIEFLGGTRGAEAFDLEAGGQADIGPEPSMFTASL